MPGCYYGSRSIGGRDPEDPGQEAETQRTPTDDALHGTRAMSYLSRCLSLIVRGDAASWAGDVSGEYLLSHMCNGLQIRNLQKCAPVQDCCVLVSVQDCCVLVSWSKIVVSCPRLLRPPSNKRVSFVYCTARTRAMGCGEKAAMFYV